MTPESIRARGTLICQRLTREVASIAPKGIGSWPRAWEITAEPDADFMAALTAWESEPMNDRAKQRVRDAYQDVLAAWRTAVAEYQDQGAEA